MSSVSTQAIKELRLKTGCGIVECKEALNEASGNLEGAHKLLREKGLAKLAKKQTRTTSQGVVAVYVDSSNDKAALVEVNTETDFASNSDVFLQFAQQLAQDIAISPDQSFSLELFSAQSGNNYQSIIGELVAKIGENVKVSRFGGFVGKEQDQFIVGYSHLRGKIGVLVKFSGVKANLRQSFVSLAKDIAMHVAASNPEYTDSKSVAPKVIEQELEIITNQLKQENKPADKIPMISKGKLNKFFEQVCLMDQKFVKDPKLSVAKVLTNFDSQVKVDGFYRYQLGENS